jgi:N-acetylmuramic acid 6-phosphate etherase
MPSRIPRTESPNRRSKNLAEMRVREIAALMLDEEARSAARLARKKGAVARLAVLAANAVKVGGRIVYVGAGTSGRLGVMDAAELLPTFGAGPETAIAMMVGGKKAVFRPVEGAEDDAAAARKEIRSLKIGKKDLVVGISASSRAAFVRSAVAEAKRRGAKTGWITSNPAHPPVDAAVILDTGSEVLAGSTRLKAATAAKIVLNIISTVAMVKSGRATGNYMTSMRPANEKLRNRAVRMVSELGGASAGESRKALGYSGWRIKDAIVLLKKRGLKKVSAR